MSDSTYVLYSTSTSITLPHLCQGYHGHCIVTSSDGGMGRFGGGTFMSGSWVGGENVGISFSIFCSVFVLLLIVVSWPVHESLLCLFPCSFFVLSLSLIPLIRC